MEPIRENESQHNGLEVAVIGMAGRFPGAKNIDQLWARLVAGEELITHFTDEELKEAGVDPELLDNPNYVKSLGFLDDIDAFDPLFFGYTPKEGEMMDPQFRFFHECAWEALENAGYDPSKYDGLIGLYAGAGYNPAWMARFFNQVNSVSEQFEASQLNARDHLCTRVAYKLNLKGPGVTVQTACSTSLVAIDYAYRGLLTGQCDIALAGGVTINFLQKSGYIYQEGMIASPDGHCRAFDAKAQGTVGGNGIGLVVLKRLDDAIADGDTIHAVIRGSAINNDGNRKAGYTAPSVEGQAEVIRMAQYMAEIEPESISYIEAHGTGTVLGDPIEVEALRLAFGTEKRQYCRLGSVKTNLGHLDTAAGVTGFIKTVLALKHRMIPASLHYKTPNPKIDFAHSPFMVNEQLTDLRTAEYPQRAGVSSFGIGGTNAHVVLEEAPVQESSAGRDWKLIMLSARTVSQLNQMHDNLKTYLEQNPEVNLADVAYTLQMGRKEFAQRRMLVVQNPREALEALQNADPRIIQNGVASESNPPVIFMFSGQGSQYVNMGVELYQTEPCFKETIDQCLELIRHEVNFDLKQILYPTEGYDSSEQLNQTFITQPALFIFEYALAKLLMSWGIQPYGMIGHSIGEYAAACLAGVFTLKDALTLVVQRGQLMQEIRRGAMISVGLSEAEIVPLLPMGLSLAAVNSHTHTVVSGPVEVMEEFQKLLEAREVQYRPLHTSHAFHSQMMEPILERFREVVQKMDLNTPELPFISNVSGDWITIQQATNPDYWVNHLRGTVRFAAGLSKLAEDETLKNGVYIEIGPGQVLSTFARQHGEKNSQLIVNCIRHPKEEVSDQYYLLTRLGQMWLKGVQINWAGFYGAERRLRIPLPTYPFEKMRFSHRTPGLTPYVQGNSSESERIVEETSLYTYSRSELPDNYLPPETEVQKQVANVLSEVLGLDQISIHESFFDLGGDSLKAVTVVAKIQKALNTELSLGEFFKTPTIEGIAKIVTKKEKNPFKELICAEPKEYYHLSSAQKRLYLIHQMLTQNTGYNMPSIMVLKGELDIKRFEQVFAQLIARHESLRTAFHLIDNEPMQQILPDVEFSIQYMEAKPDDVEQRIKNFVRPFDLRIAPLMRVGLIKLGEEEHILIIDTHHIITDGTSQVILAQEFMELYRGLELPELAIQYKDYAEWQYQELTEENQTGWLKTQEEYWLTEFSEVISQLNLLTDYPRSEVQSFKGNRLNFTINRTLTDQLKELAKTTQTTLFMVLLGSFNVLLAKICNQEEVVIGTVTDGRRHPDLKPIFGMFINTLAIKSSPTSEKSFTEYLNELKQKTLQGFDHQDYQFEDLVQKVVKTREPGRNPIFDIMFILQNMDTPELEIPGLKLLPYETDGLVSHLDLTFYTIETPEGIHCTFEYSTDLYKKVTMELLRDRFLILIANILKDPSAIIKDLEYRTQIEQELSTVEDVGFDF